MNETTSKSRLRPHSRVERLFSLRQVGTRLAILLVIAYLTLFGLIVAERGRAGLPAQPSKATIEAMRRTLDYLVNHPTVYSWHRQDTSALGLVLTLFGRSAGLLLTALGIATLIGVPLGIAAALARRLRAAPLVLLISVLGISTPSFLLAMLFWIVNVQVSRWLGWDKAPLPPTGFGWDAHLVMPALVLAARPLAQIVQVTYVSLSNVLEEDYIRTAHAKGLIRRVVINRHALRNVLIPILTTLGTSLRFSLASLPVVEAFFVWPGVGLALLEAIEIGLVPLVADLIVSLGFLFLLINLGLDVIYQLVDPRLREHGRSREQKEERRTWQEHWDDLIYDLRFRILRLRSGQVSDLGLERLLRARHQQPTTNDQRPTSNQQPVTSDQLPVTSRPTDQLPAKSRSSTWMLRSILGNAPLLVGTLLVVAFFGLAIYGESLTTASPYETHSVMVIEEEITAPPFAPSTVFPWGSDAVGRDIQALVLAGARQTLSLALLGMMARVLLGTILGLLAGWWQNTWLDRLVSSAVAVWAAFPVTLFAMILILALGIKQGVNVFVVAMCVVGWGEIAQFMRGQVLSLKPRLYIEAARSVGARTGRILTRHILPHLWAPLLVLAVLEMGSILMLLAELGFLNLFLGGGFKAEINIGAGFQASIYYFSDVPEWGALLANIRNWWRSYPWMAWYPGVAFFLAILAFNLWGEGLRRLLEDTRINLGRLINRYTAVAAAFLVFGGGWLVRSTAPLEMHKAQAHLFDTQSALKDIQALTSPQFRGRESGTLGELAAADYIAGRMEEIGLLPAGEKGGYFYTMAAPRPHLNEVPRLEILDNQGEIAEELVYRRDFVEYTQYALTYCEDKGVIVGLAVGPSRADPDPKDPHGLAGLGLYDKIAIVREADLDRLGTLKMAAGLLIVPSTPAGTDADRPDVFERKYLFPQEAIVFQPERTPVLYITPQVADRLLTSAGSSLAQLDALRQSLEPGQSAVIGAGAEMQDELKVRLVIPMAADNLAEKHYYVVGFIPGTGAQMGESLGEGLDRQVVIVSAYYDGLGEEPNGTLYPGANDNASGTAVMLEIARAIKQNPNQPRKTVVFVAWSGGERREGFSVTNAMSGKTGFNLLTIEAVIELSGVGAGSGKGIALGQASSFSLAQLFQDAAGRIGVPITTRGRGPHFDLPPLGTAGARSALSVYVSWDGSDETAHTAGDTFEAIEADKLEKVGQTTLLAVNVLGQAEAQESEKGPLTPANDYIQGARMFDEEQALEYVEYLASDELTGRRPGTPGGRAAGDYIAARFAEYGLQPGGVDATYFQPFTAPYTTIVDLPALTVFFPPGEAGTEAKDSHRTRSLRTYTPFTDYLPRTTESLGSGEAKAQVIWLYGCRDDDFAGQDVKGKIGLCNAPSTAQGHKQVTERALEHQLAGLLLIRDQTGPFGRASFRGDLTDMIPIPAFYITEVIAKDLLAGTAYKLHELERGAITAPLSTTVHMAANIKAHEIEARNVLGLLPGSDPEHKDEVVIVGAHYDHMGSDSDGTIYNGANDNASGTAVVLELARLWHAQGFRPARSVLFAAWDDEEHGMLGSKYYVQNPVYLLDHTVAMLNLDMVGVGEILNIEGRGTMGTQLQASAKVYSITVEFSPDVFGSDHLPFYEAGVPASMFMWFKEGFGLDPAYHHVWDDTQNIQPSRLRTVGVLSTHALAAWSGGGPTVPLPDNGPKRTLRDLILPTPICPTPWPPGSMTCDHGQWAR